MIKREEYNLGKEDGIRGYITFTEGKLQRVNLLGSVLVVDVEGEKSIQQLIKEVSSFLLNLNKIDSNQSTPSIKEKRVIKSINNPNNYGKRKSSNTTVSYKKYSKQIRDGGDKRKGNQRD